MNFDKIPQIDDSPKTLEDLRAAVLAKANAVMEQSRRPVDNYLHKTRFILGQLKDVLDKLYNAEWFPAPGESAEYDAAEMQQAIDALGAMRFKIDQFREVANTYTDNGPRLTKEAKRTILKILKVLKRFGVETEHTPYTQTMVWRRQLSAAGYMTMESLAIELTVVYDEFQAAEHKKEEQVHVFKKTFGGGMR